MTVKELTNLMTFTCLVILTSIVKCEFKVAGQWPGLTQF